MLSKAWLRFGSLFHLLLNQHCDFAAGIRAEVEYRAQLTFGADR